MKIDGFFASPRSWSPGYSTAVCGYRELPAFVDKFPGMLYKSSADWVSSFLQKGTLVVFDDWNFFHADSELGEGRAWREFRQRHPNLRFEPFVGSGEAQTFVCVFES